MKKKYVWVSTSLLAVACAEDSSTPGAPAGSTSSGEVTDSGACPPLDLSNCEMAFGCVGYTQAVGKLRNSCTGSTLQGRHGQGCGHDIVERVYGEGDTQIAFYDKDSGELQGWWNLSDTLEVTCAGNVPRECVSDGGELETPNVCTDAGDETSQSPTTGMPTDVTTTSSGVTSEPVEAGSPEAGPTGTLPDGSTVECCTPSEEPDCCMNYGGANIDGCYTLCDGMPLGGDWQLGVDKYGCPKWIEPPVSDNCCGCPPTPDSGLTDAAAPDSAVVDTTSMSVDASLDASR